MATGRSLAMLPWFVRDYIAATRHLSLAERGAYTDLLFLSWEIGALPKDTARLARLVGCSVEEFADVWGAIQGKFTETEEGLINSRLEQHREDNISFRDAKSRGGHSRATTAQRQNGRFTAGRHQHATSTPPAHNQQEHQHNTISSTSIAPGPSPAKHQPPSPSPSPSPSPIPTPTSLILNHPKIPNSPHASSQSEEATARARTRRAASLNGTARPRIPGAIKKSDDLQEAKTKALKLLAAGNGPGDVARMLEGHYSGLTAARVKAWAKKATR